MYYSSENVLEEHFAKVSGTGNYSESFQRHKEEFTKENEKVFQRKTNNDGVLNVPFKISEF